MVVTLAPFKSVVPVTCTESVLPTVDTNVAPPVFSNAPSPLTAPVYTPVPVTLRSSPLPASVLPNVTAVPLSERAVDAPPIVKPRSYNCTPVVVTLAPFKAVVPVTCTEAVLPTVDPNVAAPVFSNAPSPLTAPLYAPVPVTVKSNAFPWRGPLKLTAGPVRLRAPSKFTLP